MSNQTLSLPLAATARIPALVFQWTFAVCAMATPLLLVLYAFLASADAAERAQIVVQGLESTVLTLLAALALGAVHLWAVKGGVTARGAEAGLSGARASA